MVTAKNQLEDIVQGLSLGANDYLPKPFRKEELLARINTQLDLHRIFNVTGRFVPNEFLRSLGRERITEVMLGDQTQREVTVLFSDIRDYTALAESMTPQENFKFINAFHGRMGPIIRAHRGFVNQYLGDAIMAVFPENPSDALEAAVDMQKVLVRYNEERTAKGGRPIQAGMGLHTGPLIMGIIGDEQRMDATTIADTVNTASRIESLTKYYGANILLSEESWEQCGAHSQCASHLRYLGQVQVKGKKEPIGLYECFDGDPPEIVEKKLKTKADFEAGLQHFFAREFPEAVTAFNKVLKINPEDHPARFFLHKASTYTVEGVPEDWTGVEVMMFK
jgi:two-component system sensor histidine kinase ChiS